MKKSLLLATLALPFLTGSAFAATAAENWENLCASCHSADGSASGTTGKKLKIRDYTKADVQAALTDNEMLTAIMQGVKNDKGKERMKGFASEITEAEAKDLVAFIRTLKK